MHVWWCPSTLSIASWINATDRAVNRRVVVQTVFVTLLGSLLHFVWQWSGQNMLVALVGAVNESTWEHLKLAFWPAFFLGVWSWSHDQDRPGRLPALALRCTLPSFLIIGLFYGYTFLLGRHALVADLAIFVVAVGVGEWAGNLMLDHHPSKAVERMAALLLVLSLLAFSVFTFFPPDFFLFHEPSF